MASTGATALIGLVNGVKSLFNPTVVSAGAANAGQFVGLNASGNVDASILPTSTTGIIAWFGTVFLAWMTANPQNFGPIYLLWLNSLPTTSGASPQWWNNGGTAAYS